MTAAVKPEIVTTPAPSNSSAIISAVERLSTVEIKAMLTDEGAKGYFAVLPSGKRVESLKPFLDQFASAPDRITGTATLLDEASFIAHVNELKEPTTRIFADPSFEKPSFTAVYDYHAVMDDSQAPRFCAHRAVWPLKLSKEWQAWANAASKGMSALDFAEFLERNAPDVYWGDQRSAYTNTLVETLELRLASTSQLIALSRNLAINVESTVKQAQTLSSGEVSIVYTENHRDGEGKPITVPNAFLIAIPVIQGGPTYQILVRLYYRIAGGKVTWMIALYRADLVFDAAVKEICERVQQETECTVFLGSPEK